MKVKNSRILLPGVRFYAHHGVDPQEQLTGAYFHVGIEADTDFNEAMQTDRLEGTVSYADLYESIKTEMDIPSKLLEHVAGRILQRLFDDFSSISLHPSDRPRKTCLWGPIAAKPGWKSKRKDKNPDIGMNCF